MLREMPAEVPRALEVTSMQEPSAWLARERALPSLLESRQTRLPTKCALLISSTGEVLLRFLKREVCCYRGMKSALLKQFEIYSDSVEKNFRDGDAVGKYLCICVYP